MTTIDPDDDRGGTEPAGEHPDEPEVAEEDHPAESEGGEVA